MDPRHASTQLNVLMTQLMVCHTRRPIVQCGQCSFACGQCRAPHFTVYYILVLVAMSFVQPCPKCPHLQSMFVRPHSTLMPCQVHIVQVCPGSPFGSMTLWHGWNQPHTYKFTTSNYSHFSCMHANGSLHLAATPNMLASPGAN